MTHPRSSSHNAGFTLVEVLIAAGLIGGLALVLAQMAGMQQKIVATTESGLAVIELRAQVVEALKINLACVKTFENVTYPSGTATQIYRAYEDASGWHTTPLFSTDTVIDRSLRITSIQFQGPATYNGSAVAVLETEKTKDVMGGRTVRREIPLNNVTLDAANKIIGCTASGAGLGSTPAEICGTIEGATWNPTTQRCEITPATAPVQTAQMGGGITSYTGPGSTFCEPGWAHSTGWHGAGTLTISNTSTRARTYVVIGQAAVGNDHNPDIMAYMLKWTAGASGNGPIHDNVVGFDQTIADYNPPSAPAGRPNLLEVVALQTLAAGETKTYTGWVSELEGGCGRLHGGKLSAAPID